MQLDALKALDTYWNDIPRDDHHDPGEDAKFDEKFTDLAARQLGLGAAQGHPQVQARGAGRGRLSPRRAVEAFLDAYHELEQAEDRRARARCPRPPPPTS